MIFWKYLAPLRARVPKLWWYTGLMFCSSRLGDIIGLIIGIFIVPAYISQADLGAIIPLTQLSVLAAVPLTVVTGTVLKFVNVFLSQGMVGKTKRLVRDASIYVVCVSLVVVGVLVNQEGRVRSVLDVHDGRLLWVIAGIAVVSCWLPLMRTLSSATESFKTLILSRTLGPCVRLVTILILISHLRMLGYFLASLADVLFLVLFLAWGVRSRLPRDVQPASYRSHAGEMVRYFVPTAMAGVLLQSQMTLEPTMIRSHLPAADSAGYYMASMFGRIPSYVAPAILPFLFPIVSRLHEEGKSTRHLYLQGVAFCLIAGLSITVLFVLFGYRILGLRDTWAAYAAYGPHIWEISLMYTLHVALSAHCAYHAACRSFSYLWVLAPILLAENLLIVLVLRGVVTVPISSLGPMIWIMIAVRAVILLGLFSQFLFFRDSTGAQSGS